MAVVCALAFTMAGAYMLPVAPSFADETADLETRLKDTERGIKDAKSAYRGKKNKAASYGTQIAELEASIQKVEAELKALAAEMERNSREITKTEEDIARLQTEVGVQNSELLGRLRLMYTAGNSNMIEVLLDSASIVEFLTNLDMIQRIHAQDIKDLDALTRKLDTVEQKKAELAGQKAALEQRRATEKQKKSELAAEKKKLAAAQAKASSEAAEALENLEDMEAASKAIAAELKKLKSRGSYQGGKMGWPVSGSISSGFGWRIHPISGLRRMHAGIDISAPTGTPVHASSDGVVVKSENGWNGGYGNIVIVDHGSGIMSVYGHNSSLAVSVGQNVKRGDVIAYVGSTGNSTGPHCHFEVRVNGVEQNPMGWL